MTPQEHLAARLRIHEGRMLKVYDDATGKPIGPGTPVRGYPSIGYGRNLASRGLSVEEAELLLRNDITIVEREVDRALPDLVPMLDAARRSVLYEMAYNLGTPTLLKFKIFLACLKEGHTEEAARAMLLSRWATQVGRRATRLAQIIRTGEWGNDDE